MYSFTLASVSPKVGAFFMEKYLQMLALLIDPTNNEYLEIIYGTAWEFQFHGPQGTYYEVQKHGEPIETVAIRLLDKMRHLKSKGTEID